MSLPYELLRNLQESEPVEAWASILQYSWDICSRPIEGNAHSEVVKRDRSIADVDHFIATAGWELWGDYLSSVPLTSNKLKEWWASQTGGCAVLVLDALSLREVPWLIQGAGERGYVIHTAQPSCAELPADTTPFAKALGFSQRSSLANDGASKTHALKGAKTESSDMTWADCASTIGSEPKWVFWHRWPDHKLHDYSDPGKGLSSLVEEIASHLTRAEFWDFISRLTDGRRLVITSDHGYAASGLFPDAAKDQSDYLKRIYKSGRSASVDHGAGPWIPPIDLVVETPNGPNLFVTGRKKWKNSGGYPALTHGGLSILEVASPFIEISKPVGN